MAIVRRNGFFQCEILSQKTNRELGWTIRTPKRVKPQTSKLSIKTAIFERISATQKPRKRPHRAVNTITNTYPWTELPVMHNKVGRKQKEIWKPLNFPCSGNFPQCEPICMGPWMKYSPRRWPQDSGQSFRVVPGIFRMQKETYVSQFLAGRPSDMSWTR